MNGNSNGSTLQVLEEIATGALFLFSGNVLATLFSAICGILVAKLLGPDLYGAYSLAFVPISFLAVFTGLGLNYALTRYIAYYSVTKEMGGIAPLVMSGLLFTALESTVICILALILVERLTVVFINRPELVDFVRIVLPLVVLQAVLNANSGVLIGFGDTKRCALTTVVLQLSRLVVAPTLIVIGLGVSGALAGNVLAYVIGVAMSLFFIYRNCARSGISLALKKSTAISAISLMLSYGLPLYMSSVLNSSIETVRGVILAYVASDYVVGNFNVALRFTSLVTLLLGPISSVLVPTFTKIGESREEIVKMFFYSIKYSSLLVAPATIFISTMSRDLVLALLGPEYVLAAWYLSILVLNYLYVGLGYTILGSLFSGVGDTKVNFKATVINALVFTSISLTLVQVVGVEGVVASILLATGMSTLYSLCVARRKYGLRPDLKPIAAIYLSALLSVLPVIPIAVYIQVASPIKLSIAGIVYALAYLTLTPLVKAIDSKDVQTLASIFAKFPLIRPLVIILVKYEKKVLTLLT